MIDNFKMGLSFRRKVCAFKGDCIRKTNKREGKTKMKLFNRIISVVTTLFLTIGLVACNNTGSSSSSDVGGSSSGGGMTEIKDPLYQIEDVVKQDLMWDTSTLFETVPEIKKLEDIQIAKRIEAFKFKSVGYQDKENTWVFGAVGTPATEMPKDGYPAVVLIHGGGGHVFGAWMSYWMEKGFVAIAIDMFGNELNYSLQKVSNPDGGPREHDGSNFDGVEDVTQSWVYHSVHNVVMAHNLLRAREDVDVDRIVATGISWGGFITNIVAGLDKRFTAFAPVYGSGFVYEDSFWTNGHGTFGGEENRQQWINLYDPSSYLPYATKPMLFVSGIDDSCFAVENRVKSAELVKGKVFYSQRSDLSHGNFWMLTPEICAFFQHVLYGQNTITQFGEVVVNNGVATLKTENDLYHSVNFLYTTSKDEDSHKWEWRTLSVTKVNGVYSCAIPQDATAYLFETVGDSNPKDKDGFFRQSTSVYFQ